MSYSFVDTIGTPGENTLPAEALSINGQYIENQITGYQTLNVSGRETFVQEPTETEVGVHHGAFLSSRRYPVREIKVTFQLVAPSNEDYRSRFNALNKILNVQDAQLIFADEDDKFFVGTPSAADEIEPGSNSVVGSFTLRCYDPFKYSVQEYIVTPTAGTFSVNYDGTYPASPVFEAAFNSACGYVTFVDADGNDLQFGDPGETEEITETIERITSGEPRTAEQRLLFDDFENGISNWTLNSANSFVSKTSYTKEGTLQAAIIGSGGTSKALRANSYGDTTNKEWHGPTAMKAVSAAPADHGTSGTRSRDFLLDVSLRFAAANTNGDKQSGMFQAFVLDSQNRYIAGISVWKSSGNLKGKMRAYIRGHSTVKEWTDVDLSHYNKMFGYRKKETDKRPLDVIIQKTGAEFKFTLGTETFTTSATDRADDIGQNVCFYFAKWKDNTPLSALGIYNCKFIDKAVQYADELTTVVGQYNVFDDDDILVADCSDASVSLKSRTSEAGVSGGLRPDLGALGNKWEQFKLNPGSNNVTAEYSDWSEHAPTFKMKYRKKYI